MRYTLISLPKFNVKQFSFVTVSLGILLSGCGDDNVVPNVTKHPVTGKVLLANGQPLTGGRVVFVPSGGKSVLQASGNIGSDGSYKLETSADADGASEGDYRVRIEPPSAEGTVGKKTKVTIFNTKYLDEETSELKVSVKAGTNDVPTFQLK